MGVPGSNPGGLIDMILISKGLGNFGRFLDWNEGSGSRDSS